MARISTPPHAPAFGAWLIAAALVAAQPAQAEDAPDAEQAVPERKRWWEDFAGGEPVTMGRWTVYRKDGLRFDSDLFRTRLKLNASLYGDTGYIGLNDELQTAFPGAEGWHAKITQARLTLQGWLFDQGMFKAQLEFAEQVQIKDLWWQFNPLPYVGWVTLGNMKEPFSLSAIGSSADQTFMSDPLPALAFAPGRNIGVMARNTVLDGDMSWAIGGFWNTGSFSDFSGAKDSFSNANGFHVTGRITYLPTWQDDGRELTHLGLSLSLQSFTGEAQNRAAPETSLINQYFVDTGQYQPDRAVVASLEFARVQGPWSVQAELMFDKLQAPSLGDPLLTGAYVFASHVLTGEHRLYDRSSGTFDGVLPKIDFSWANGHWGAFELAMQLSTLNLNGGTLAGGRERNVSLGLNWYLDANTRMMFEYVHALVNGRGYTPAVDGGRANILQARLQLAF